MTTHTTGRLAAYGRVVRIDTDGSEDQVAHATQSDEDARRLAACWNVCNGTPTDNLEDTAQMGPEPMQFLLKRAYGNHQYLVDVISQRNGAYAQLEQLVKAFGEWEQQLPAGARSHFYAITERARDFLNRNPKTP